MTQLTPTLYAVEVPSDATEIKIGSLNMGIYFYVNERIDCVNLGFNLKDNFKILGEATKDEISFDVEPYVEHLKLDFEEKGFMFQFIKDGFVNHTYSPEKYFRSLLQSKGIYFENPVKNFPKKASFFRREDYLQAEAEWEDNWQESENKVIKGKLIILEKL